MGPTRDDSPGTRPITMAVDSSKYHDKCKQDAKENQVKNSQGEDLRSDPDRNAQRNHMAESAAASVRRCLKFSHLTIIDENRMDNDSRHDKRTTDWIPNIGRQMYSARETTRAQTCTIIALPQDWDNGLSISEEFATPPGPSQVMDEVGTKPQQAGLHS